MKAALSSILNIQYPIICAPMFLVSNIEMVIAACEAGISGSIPAMNFRTIPELKEGLRKIRSATKQSFGVNLIVNQSNFQLKKQLHTCIDEGVDYFITSLGGPKNIMKESKANNIKVFCDVINKEYAKKVIDLGADALIAVNSGAGGHAGNIPASVLIPMLKELSSLPIISAGGVGNGASAKSMFELGADGLSIGSPFIACEESDVSQEYKQACVQYGGNDIVKTNKISGTPCTVIKTPYVEKIGTEQNPIEKFLNKNKKIKKYARLLTYKKGMGVVSKAAFGATYKSVWCAGPSIEFVKSIRPINQIVSELISDYNQVKELSHE